MKWFRQAGEPKFEDCKELVIDFENQKICYSAWCNHPMGGNGKICVFAFIEVDGEDFQLVMKYDFCTSLDRVFGDNAQADFDRILKMSKEEYSAQGLDRKEVTVDFVGNEGRVETRYGMPYQILHRIQPYSGDPAYDIVYDETPSTKLDAPAKKILKPS
jgi:hypothetical protein